MYWILSLLQLFHKGIVQCVLFSGKERKKRPFVLQCGRCFKGQLF